jgi:hypothetical protein
MTLYEIVIKKVTKNDNGIVTKEEVVYGKSVLADSERCALVLAGIEYQADVSKPPLDGVSIDVLVRPFPNK